MNSIIARIAIIFLVVAGCFHFGCEEKKPPESSAERPLIVTTAFPIASIVEQMVGDWAEVRVLPRSDSPGNRDASNSSFELLSNAMILVVSGDPADEATAALAKARGTAVEVISFSELARQASRPSVAASGPATTPATAPSFFPASQPQHRASMEAGNKDACPWLDLLGADRFIAALEPRLEAHFPGREQPLRNRVQLFRTNILMLYQEYQVRFSGAPNQKIVLIGDDLLPLVRALGLNAVVSIRPDASGRFDGAELDKAADRVRADNLTAAYASATLPREAANAVALKTGLRIVRIDPYGGPGVEGYSNYLKLMQSDLATLAENQFGQAATVLRPTTSPAR